MPFHDLGQGVDSDTLVARATSSGAAAPPIALSRKARAREAASLRVRDVTIRALNVLMALILILFSFPFMAVIALAVRLTSKGPVIFAQDRVGLDARNRARRRGASRFRADRRRKDSGGKVFKIYKFRTMFVVGSEVPQVWASPQATLVSPPPWKTLMWVALAVGTS